MSKLGELPNKWSELVYTHHELSYSEAANQLDAALAETIAQLEALPFHVHPLNHPQKRYVDVDVLRALLEQKEVRS